MFLSIKQALEKYEASQTTLTRFARENQKTKNVKKEGGKFYILDSFLASHFQAVNSHLVSQTISANSHSEEKKDSKKDLELVTILKTQNEFLQNQIKEKDKQLNDKSSQIDKLLQRQYEQNSIRTRKAKRQRIYYCKCCNDNSVSGYDYHLLDCEIKFYNKTHIPTYHINLILII